MALDPIPTLVTSSGSGNSWATNELPVEMHPKLLTAFPELTPLTSMLTRVGEDPSFNFRTDWIEKAEIPTKLIVATSEASAGTSVVFVAGAETLVPDTLLYNPRVDDIRLVSSVSTQTATVVISQGSKTSAAWLAGDEIEVMLPALAENDTANTRAVMAVNSSNYNLHQLCKLQYSLTFTQDTLKTFPGFPSKREELKGQKYREYRIKKEKLFYYGGLQTGGTAPATRRMMGGLNHFLRSGTLYKDFGGTLTETGFRNYIGQYKEVNPDATEVYVFAAGNVCDIVSDFGHYKLQIDPMSSVFGLDIMQYKSRGITARLVPLPLLTGPYNRGWGWILDFERITMKAMAKDTFYPWDRTRGAGGEIMYDTYLGQYTARISNEIRHSMFTGALA